MQVQQLRQRNSKLEKANEKANEKKKKKTKQPWRQSQRPTSAAKDCFVEKHISEWLTNPNESDP
jgi:hypothetical protein